MQRTAVAVLLLWYSHQSRAVLSPKLSCVTARHALLDAPPLQLPRLLSAQMVFFQSCSAAAVLMAVLRGECSTVSPLKGLVWAWRVLRVLRAVSGLPEALQTQD